ncbi:hypothetical protein PSR25_18525 [Acinetobacter pittii]|uniref:hypothetical protein n=1 Tax=Acinetobacter pittii TaxID=48296 RepID=UPI00308ECD5E|nr:hypothetical protein PSR25_18525 [Acinetobacter pittii]
MGAESFRDLLDLKKKAIEAEIASILERLRACNKQIISLEDQNDPAFKESLKSKIKVKKEELETHRLNKPTEILDPSLVSQSPENERKKAELLQHEKNRDDQITLKNHYEQNLKNCNRTKLEIENLIREINNKVGELKSCLENGLKLFEELEINKIEAE